MTLLETLRRADLVAQEFDLCVSLKAVTSFGMRFLGEQGLDPFALGSRGWASYDVDDVNGLLQVALDEGLVVRVLTRHLNQ